MSATRSRYFFTCAPQRLDIALLCAMVHFVISVSTAEAQVDESPVVTATASFQLEKGTRRGWLIVNLDIPDGSHIYSLTQPAPLPPTKIAVAESPEIDLTGEFRPHYAPQVVERDPVFGKRVETYKAGTAVFLAPIVLQEKSLPENVEIQLAVEGLVCSANACSPLSVGDLPVTFGGYYEPPPTQNAKRP